MAKVQKATKAKGAKGKKKAKGKAMPDVWEVPADANPLLTSPKKANKQAPERFKVKFVTTKGDFTVDVTRSWSPNGADRFYNLARIGYFEKVKFFRAIDNFMVQFGISPYPAVSKKWKSASIKDDPPKQSNTRGMMTFAMAGPNTRTTQIFISYKNNAMLDSQGFSPFGKIDDEGMKVVDSLFKGYGEGAPRGRGPHQGKVQMFGNAYLEAEFPKLDEIKRVKVIE